jgi:hypothetical protein
MSTGQLATSWRYCQVSGSGQVSRDLPQRGLEIPCFLIFSGQDTDINNLKQLLNAAGPDKSTATLTIVEQDSVNQEPNAKKRRQLLVDKGDN